MVSPFSKQPDSMSTLATNSLSSLLFGWLYIFLSLFAQGACAKPKLEILVTATLNQAPVRYDHLGYTNAHGQVLSISRFDFLLSDFAVRTPGGIWSEQTNRQAWLALGSGRSRVSINNPPDTCFDRIKFRI